MKKLDGGDELFFHSAVLDFYSDVMNVWENNGRFIALLLGCSKHKPYSESFIHKKIIGMLKKHNFDDIVQQLIISEPLVVCPREWENRYPAAHYEFPPERLGEEGMEIFVMRLRDFFKKFNDQYSKYIVFTPNHHRKIILAAAEGIIDPVIIPYNIYQLPKLLNVIESCVSDI
ncbi:MAG TPA: hypothetical protein ENI52_03750 [Thermoplasmata archaeon]|nr:hypothetical protein [Thermoplasmata archaeon]